mgnify:CR=1 FL=1
MNYKYKVSGGDWWMLWHKRKRLAEEWEYSHDVLAKNISIKKLRRALLLIRQGEK